MKKEVFAQFCLNVLAFLYKKHEKSLILPAFGVCSIETGSERRKPRNRSAEIFPQKAENESSEIRNITFLYYLTLVRSAWTGPPARKHINVTDKSLKGVRLR